MSASKLRDGSFRLRAIPTALAYFAYNWTLSPDGKLLAAGKGKALQKEPNITFIALAEGSKRNVTAEAWAGSTVSISPLTAAVFGHPPIPIQVNGHC